MKVLLLTSEPISAAELRSALAPPGGARLDEVEVKVVAPALHESALQFWLSDADAAIGRAERVAEETVRDLSAARIDEGEIERRFGVPVEHVLKR